MASQSFTQPRATFFEAFAVQCRVIGALIMRELHTRYGRDNVGYLWMVGEPMILASVISLLHAASNRVGHSGDIMPVPFAIIGYTAFIVFRGILNRSAGAIESNAALLYHRSVTVLDISIARAILEFSGAFVTYTILMCLAIGLGFAHPPARLLPLIAAWGMITWYAWGHSLIVSAITYENRTAERLVHPYSYFMVGLSGAFMPMSWLPDPFRGWLGWIPITSIFELARYGQFRDEKLTYFYGTYLIGACLVLTWIGLVLLNRVKKHIHLP